MKKKSEGLHVVGVVIVGREGRLASYCLNSLEEHCDEVVIMLDNYDALTERVAKIFGHGKGKLIYSWAPNIPKKFENKRKKLEDRLDEYKSAISMQVSERLKKIDSKRRIDIILWPDSLTTFTREIPDILIDFYNSGTKAMSTGISEAMGSFKRMKEHVRTPSICAFRYSRGELNYSKFPEHEITKIGRALVSFKFLNKKTRELIRANTEIGINPDEDSIWYLDKNICEMTTDEINAEMIRKPDSNVKEHIKIERKIHPSKYMIKKLLKRNL